ncbi:MULTISPECIES: hypothetical protein [Empedobacter]|uniref:DUF4157 domain-containing protein n=2 Tax=Empedobacter TaxID=59734 RepID=A0ABY8V8T0_9FLAO|nr:MULTISPECIES: hypothetical protein [Empedobacter]MCA4777961.1 hypothetical protein [Empedobacter stercoris]MCA4809259.1 hypothetical protein [Empedobacter stercoris]MDM1524291.1 hypothetical protein [Empedobacter sp. 225-1]MDM1544212.1 hypothetical protein [Empedobacter sp. 189-2]NOJ74956.1 hypothetical protein [Empedobacter stercoris]
MFVVVLNRLFRKNFIGITIFPFIFLRDKKLKNDTVLINHETIHIIQQLELLVVFFYPFYLIEYMIRLVQYRDQHKAYRNISFEREAYANDHNLNYLKERKFYSFLKYL